MPSLMPDYEYDIFISYRHNDNRSGWVTEFVNALQEELAATIKEPLAIYFDKNPHDGLLETHHVDKSLEGKLKCLIFIPIISQTYCDPKSFAWQHEFCAFNKLAQEDQIGRDIKLGNGNVASRILPIKIHDLDLEDTSMIENEIDGVVRAIEFIYKEAGVNRPLAHDDSDERNLNRTKYKNQVNKVANAIKEIVIAIKNPTLLAKKTADKKVSANTPKTNKRLITGVVALLLLVTAIYFIYPTFQSIEIKQEITDKSIAVLPFDDFIEEESMKYFADGLTEEILNVLAKAPDLKVASRTSSFQYKDKDDDARKIAKELGVAHIIEGSVRGSAERMRITVQLIRASDGFHLWSETYDKTKDDVIQIQEDIALKIAQAMQTAMDPVALKDMMQSGTSNIEAYTYYLKGLSFGSFAEGYDDFEKARALDPTFALAHYRAARFWYSQLLITAGESDKTDKSYLEKIDLYNQRIELAIQYALPVDRIHYHANQAFVNMEFRKALNLYKQYTKERPNETTVLREIVSLLVFLGDYKEAGFYADTFAKNILHNEANYSRAINTLFHARKYTQGSEFARKALLEFPNSEGVLYQAHRIFLWSGMMNEAREAYKGYMQLGITRDTRIVKLRQACAEGDSVLAYSIYSNEIESNGRYITKWLSLMCLGKSNEAIRLLKPLEESGELFSLSSWLHYSIFDAKHYPKLQAILERENANQRELIELPFALKTTANQ